VGISSTEQLQSGMPFARVLGVEIVAAAADEVRARMPWRAEHCTSGGVLHGGVLVAFADSVGAVCAGWHAPNGMSGTVELKVNYLRPVASGWVTSVSRPMHVGGSTLVVQTELFDEADRRVALLTQTHMRTR
jgi:1,4-dihydroxy-2-naphthoyl-CoA hydrolase